MTAARRAFAGGESPTAAQQRRRRRPLQLRLQDSAFGSRRRFAQQVFGGQFFAQNFCFLVEVVTTFEYAISEETVAALRKTHQVGASSIDERSTQASEFLARNRRAKWRNLRATAVDDDCKHDFPV